MITKLKTFLIRALINYYSDKKFIYVGLEDFLSMIQAKKNYDTLKDKIIILEDCEELLKDRSRSAFTAGISNLLNMTDGLLGDSFNIKAICTFNADMSQIDKALTRKGRIKLMYELKPLTQDRADALRKKLGRAGGKSNTLCDIYNEDTVGVSDSIKSTRIGF